MKKKGVLGKFFTWVVAFLVIVLILAVFSGINFGIAGKKFLFGGAGKEIKTIKEDSCKRELGGVLIRLAQTKVEFEEEKTDLIKLVSEKNLEDSGALDVYKKASEEIFAESFPIGKGAHPWWVRIYGIDEKMKKLDRRDSHVGGHNCDPDEDIVSEIVFKDNKIVACVFKTYCEDIK